MFSFIGLIHFLNLNNRNNLNSLNALKLQQTFKLIFWCMDPQKDVTLTQYNLVSELTIWHLFISFYLLILTWSLYLSLVSSLLELMYFLNIFLYHWL